MKKFWKSLKQNQLTSNPKRYKSNRLKHVTRMNNNNNNNNNNNMAPKNNAEL